MFRNDASAFVYTRTYARWIESLNRRETWDETVSRYITFLQEERGEIIPPKVMRKIQEKMLSFNVMPSMRALWASGPAAKASNVSLYNCAFLEIDSLDAFAEVLYILMCGAGVGFSVRNKVIAKLPSIPNILPHGIGEHVVVDSKEGWADSVKALFNALFSGKDISMNYSKIRPRGARLKTMGGRASGPEPLITLHNYIRDVVYAAQGRKLKSIECHDICNQIAEIVIVGGVRRSSEISISDLDDIDMRNSKIWPFPARRNMANNSAAYDSKPSSVTFLQEWAALAASGTGERGIINLEAIRKHAGRRKVELIEGVNPCGEVTLRSCSFCNLSEVVIRADDDLDSLLEKVETAAWIGTIQASFSNFPYLRKTWQDNCNEERLLGISLTGQMDAPHLLTPDNLKAMRSRAIKISKKAATILKINAPAAVTCVKPSGTVSNVVDCAAGMHPRHSKFYIRRYRISATDPLFHMMRDQGFKFSPENGESKELWEAVSKGIKPVNACPIYRPNEEWSEDKVSTWVVSYPIKSPDTATVRNFVSAIDQLELYKNLQLNWSEHNSSLTVYVRDDEWIKVGEWVYSNWDIVKGISFLPHDGGHYEQAPYEECTEAKYNELLKKVPKIDYSKLYMYESDDGAITGSKELACSGGVCELV